MILHVLEDGKAEPSLEIVGRMSRRLDVAKSAKLKVLKRDIVDFIIFRDQITIEAIDLHKNTFVELQERKTQDGSRRLIRRWLLAGKKGTKGLAVPLSEKRAARRKVEVLTMRLQSEVEMAAAGGGGDGGRGGIL
ncbi:hypothetical protein L1987_37270 [Smallanthus sonchifolius]|uniref:Uncharacterized protein n=1 Tax=Smallanthus sonchifolius TaxID=185202 RepID=A0ACB9HIG9_9ASTR|nr:hypothetical protein L1987_37270 [Smallanthus sonchifolius]